MTRKWLGICYLRTVNSISILKVMPSLCQLQGHIQGEFMHFTCRHWRGGRIHALHMQPLTRRRSSSLHAAIDEEEEFISPCSHWRGGRVHALHMQRLTRRKSSCTSHAAIDKEEEFISPCSHWRGGRVHPSMQTATDRQHVQFLYVLHPGFCAVMPKLEDLGAYVAKQALKVDPYIFPRSLTLTCMCLNKLYSACTFPH